MDSALIVSTVAPLRKAASSESVLEDEALCGYQVELLEQKGRWHRVRTHYRYEGWVWEEDLLRGTRRAESWKKVQKLTVMQAHADILSEPKVQGILVQDLTKGALVTPTGESRDGWEKVRLCSGREGWIWGAFLGSYLTTWNRSEEEKVRNSLAETALSYLGVQYRWGGKTPLGIDCSGLCSMSYLLNGILINRDAFLAPGFCMHKIPLENIKKGDLLFFPGHVALYLGGRRYIHSTTGNNCHGVVINSLDPDAPDYRADLPPKILYAGSIF